MAAPDWKPGDAVAIAPHSNWTAYFKRLAESVRPGVVERVFTPLGSDRPLVRVVFPKRGRAKELTEVVEPADLVPLPTDPSQE